MACAVSWMVLATSAFGALLDCGMHGQYRVHAAEAREHSQHCGSRCPKGPHREPGGSPSHSSGHPNGPLCCHASLYNVPLPASGVPSAGSDARWLSVSFHPFVSAPANACPATTTGRGGSPPGGWAKNGTAFGTRPLFLVALSLRI